MKKIISVITFLMLFTTAFASTTLEFGFNRPGMDYKSFDLSSPNPNLCKSACESDMKCKAWTYVKPGVQGPNAKCWLKYDIPNKISDPNCVSGAKLTSYGNYNNSTLNFRYLGCYKDSGDPNGTAGRDLNGLKIGSNDMTVEKCIKICSERGFSYAAVQYSTQCFCGNSYGKFGKANNCNMRCAGNPNQVCGGTWANSVYEILIPQQPHISVLDLTGVWQGDDGGKYYIRQINNEIWWYGEKSPNNPLWSNVAHGVIKGDIIEIKWADVPKGTMLNNGKIKLKIDSMDSIYAVEKQGGFGANSWRRLR